jgi:hypothetical protein
MGDAIGVIGCPALEHFVHVAYYCVRVNPLDLEVFSWF